MNIAELTRRINNLIVLGAVTESKSADGLSLARVKILDRVTDFLPVMQTASSFKKHAAPVKEGTQVLVFHPYGNADSGVIIGSIFNKGEKEPVGYSDTKEVTEYADGTVISYDTTSKVLDINAVGDINIICANATIQADSASITADTVTVDSPSIDLGTGGAGVVTGESICPFTGAPHSDVSTNTRSSK
jgi:phage baseplate assembly protein V